MYQGQRPKASSGVVRSLEGLGGEDADVGRRDHLQRLIGVQREAQEQLSSDGPRPTGPSRNCP
jgi:hypothetical protein